MKKCLLIGNANGVAYKEVFPLIKDCDLVVGYHKGAMEFELPDRYTKYQKIINGKKYATMPNIYWYTTLKTTKPAIKVNKTYNEEDYPKYDNYDARNCDKLKDIPKDYDGVLGVPITIMWYLDSEGFIKVDDE